MYNNRKNDDTQMNKNIVLKNSQIIVPKFYGKNYLITTLFYLLIWILTPEINFLFFKKGVCLF